MLVCLKNWMNLFTPKLSLEMDNMLRSKAKELWLLKLSGIKYISDVLFVPKINQSLLSVGQMMEKNYSLHFKDMKCTIFDPYGSKLMIVEMRGKSFPVEWKRTSLRVFSSRVEANFSAQKRGTLDGNYARCNIVVLETARYTEAANFEG